MWDAKSEAENLLTLFEITVSWKRTSTVEERLK